ncbi:Translocon-associated protein subunit alpha [Trichinella papuae]|uniref:Translocon-associated protein subunit alpha n=1 Tax=Trichinella papuae TaxID=268474 RepID=A0A0V1MI45_9BILA|nr:Translocon-associated protein subunit alpha [Trichinella papuae]
MQCHSMTNNQVESCKMVFGKWFITAVCLLLISIPVRNVLSADEDDDDDLVEEESDKLKAGGGKSLGDSDDEEVVEGLAPSPDIEAVVLFTEPPNSKELPAGKPAHMLISFFNGGIDEYFVDNIQAFLKYPTDYSYNIHNYSIHSYHQAVYPDTEASFEYSMMAFDTLAGRPFGLVVLVDYKLADGREFRSTVFNETVHIVEEESAFNPEMIFLVMVFVIIGCLVAVFAYQFIAGKSRKHGVKKRVQVEMGTTNAGDVDLDWIPKQILAMSERSRQPAQKTSPRMRKNGKNAHQAKARAD